MFKRYNPAKGETAAAAKEETMSPQMIWRVANAFVPGQPTNLDRVLGASYNSRSVLESLLAHAPQFYFCYPGRIENINSSTEIKHGHKHLIWLPDDPHENGVTKETETEIVISEIPSTEVVYEALSVPSAGRTAMDIDLQRRHAQIQLALIMIGAQLGYKSWVAQNDKGIVYKGKKIAELPEVIKSLSDLKLFSGFADAVKAAHLIDCLWFEGDRQMPAVMEVEHTTGVTSGLTRMKGLQDALPPYPTRYVIVAPDEDREKVVSEISREQFKSLNARFFPYSSVEELYGLCQRRKLGGITQDFLDSWMEKILG